VVQVMVAPVVVIAVAVTAEMVGATAVVVKVALGEVVDRLELLVETTLKSYSVPGVKPVFVTECEVTSALLSVDCEP
jgi:hypothetical protein